MCSNFVQSAKNKNVPVKGPVRIPTKVLRITTRKTPCGEGSKTWDRFEFRIHKRVIDFIASAEIVKEIVSSMHVCCDVFVSIRVDQPEAGAWC